MSTEPVVLHTIIFFGIIILSLISMLTAMKVIKNRIWAVYPVLVSIVAYFIYEVTMPNHYNIRVDLLIIYPALIVGVISLFIVMAQVVMSKRKGR